MTIAGFVQGTVVNVFLLLGFVAFFSMMRDWPSSRIRSIPVWVNGLLFGSMATVAMMMPINLGPGLIFDCRSGIMGTAALIGGPICALASIPIPFLYRLYFGGSGLFPGLLEIILPVIVGSVCHQACRISTRGLSVRLAVRYSLVVGLIANSMVVGSIVIFIPSIKLLSSDFFATFAFLLAGPISMALFSTFILLSQQHAENSAIHDSILQTAMDGYLLMDMNGRLCEINETYSQMSGRSRQEMLAMRISDLEAMMNERQLADLLKELIAIGGKRFESAHQRKDGSIFEIEASVRYLSVAGGRFVSFIRDITEHKKAQEALRESERKYKLLIETTNTGYVILDYAGKVLDANQEYLRMTGRTRMEDIVDKAVTEWTAPHDLQRNMEAVRQCMRDGLIRNLEIDYLDAQGQLIPVEVQASVLSDSKSVQIISICRDITERRLAVKEREQLVIQLTQAQKLESIGRLAGGIAHDFNNMLGVIIGWADIIQNELLPEKELYAALGNIMEAARRSADLTQQLLAFARKQHIEPKIINLNDTIESMIKMLRRLIGEDIRLLWKPAAALEPVLIDPIQIDQILANLCLNARDAIGQNIGAINIETGIAELDEEFCKSHPGAATGHYVMLSVHDSGCGMDPEILANIFEPFFTTKSLGKGTGLGLATVYGIVNQNKGYIDVHSEQGKGTTFSIYLPCHAVAPLDKSKPVSAMESSHGHKTILIVEDEAHLLKALQTMLIKLGYTVLAAAMPTEAIRLAAEQAGPLQLLITDMVMPEMNGPDLARHLSQRYPDLKCLFISGYASDDISPQHIYSEGRYYLQKPFAMNDLALKIKTILDS